MTSLDRAVVLVAGADGGLGAEFVRQALERSAAIPTRWRAVDVASDTTWPTS